MSAPAGDFAAFQAFVLGNFLCIFRMHLTALVIDKYKRVTLSAYEVLSLPAEG